MSDLGWTLIVTIAMFSSDGFALNHTVDGAFDPRVPTHFPSKEVCERFAGILIEKYASSVNGLSAVCVKERTKDEIDEMMKHMKSVLP